MAGRESYAGSCPLQHRPQEVGEGRRCVHRRAFWGRCSVRSSGTSAATLRGGLHPPRFMADKTDTEKVAVQSEVPGSARQTHVPAPLGSITVFDGGWHVRAWSWLLPGLFVHWLGKHRPRVDSAHHGASSSSRTPGPRCPVGETCRGGAGCQATPSGGGAQSHAAWSGAALGRRGSVQAVPREEDAVQGDLLGFCPGRWVFFGQ